MEYNKNELTALLQDWQKLNSAIKNKQHFDIKFFEEVFSKTFTLLSQYAGADSVDKSYVELIAVAYLFANSENNNLDSKYLAMHVLTERMLNSCVFSRSTEPIDISSVYILKTRKEVALNFNNVRKSISTLEKIFEEVYWDDINAGN